MIHNRRFENWTVTLLLAVTTALAAMWVLEPMLVASSWQLRVALATGCLITAVAMFRLEMMRQTRHERVARQFIDVLCRQDIGDLDNADEDSPLPSLDRRNAWTPILSFVREYLTECGRRAEKAERACTGTEIRMRRLEDDHAQLREILKHLADPVLAINQYDEKGVSTSLS